MRISDFNLKTGDVKFCGGGGGGLSLSGEAVPQLHICEEKTNIEISVNWPGSKQVGTRPIYTDFNGAN